MDYKAKKVVVTAEKGKLDLKALTGAVGKAGFTAKVTGQTPLKQ